MNINEIKEFSYFQDVFSLSQKKKSRHFSSTYCFLQIHHHLSLSYWCFSSNCGILWSYILNFSWPEFSPFQFPHAYFSKKLGPVAMESPNQIFLIHHNFWIRKKHQHLFSWICKEFPRKGKEIKTAAKCYKPRDHMRWELKWEKCPHCFGQCNSREIVTQHLRAK